MNNFDLQKLIDRLLVKYPAFASTIVNTNYREEPNDGIATDGENIYYDLNFLNKLTFDEQLFAFAHEICHIRSNHILRSKGKNQKLQGEISTRRGLRLRRRRRHDRRRDNAPARR